jgi:hypothetical protein
MRTSTLSAPGSMFTVRGRAQRPWGTYDTGCSFRRRLLFLTSIRVISLCRPTMRCSQPLQRGLPPDVSEPQGPRR